MVGCWASFRRTCLDEGRPAFSLALSLFFERPTFGSEESMMDVNMD